ncbi:MAG TPA: hypothetical protein VFJ02_06170 [Vicinamibacterales bacterium]|nr:hypothetical protein [Vicinamibacterales bacterium]
MSIWLTFSSTAFAQAKPPQDPHAGHQQPQQQPAHEHMQHGEAASAFQAREGSGTSWLPDDTPMYGLHRSVAPWQLMGHGNLFVQYLYEGGDRGTDQFGSINWLMGMARRNVGSGWLGVRGMFSLEPATIRGCGYPDLLATGEVCDGESIHDRQHPHDLFMELAVEYDRPIGSGVRLRLYGGPAGEPALGPVAYPHRLSALPNPLAPISHHWLDATHITFGVVTAGVYGKRWKAEGSAFNGREPDEERANFDFGALDSVSGRAWFLPTSSLALQVSAGRLSEAEPAHAGADTRVDVTRVTASATYHRTLASDSRWATTLAWGRNEEEDEATHALLVETSLMLRERDTWFGRFEVGGKSAHDLDIHGVDEVFTVSKLQAGYTRYWNAWRGLTPGIGGSLSLGFVPDGLRSAYGSRANVGVGVFVTLKPGTHSM